MSRKQAAEAGFTDAGTATWCTGTMGWLLPRPMPVPPLATDRLYDNADSFAQSFDAAWKALGNSPEDANHRIDLVLDQLRDHPFMISRPAMARQVADFRIRLLGL